MSQLSVLPSSKKKRVCLELKSSSENESVDQTLEPSENITYLNTVSTGNSDVLIRSSKSDESSILTEDEQQLEPQQGPG